MAVRREEKRVLVLQGGGALGAYQAGAYEVLAASDEAPDWIAGISIGAVNGAIIAGNPPERRIERLRAFWDKLSSGLQGWSLIPGENGRTLFNDASAWFAILYGIPGFFSPRFPPPTIAVPGSSGALSFYEAGPLRATLEALVDFDYLNDKGPRLSIGAVGVESGNFAYFDSAKTRIGPEHVMASGALPPGLPPVVIDGEAFWDGGIVSNTPLHYVLDFERPREDLCIFQLDLFSSKGVMPRTIFEVVEREKEIRYSSRTRLVTDMMAKRHEMRCALRRLLAKLPKNLRNDPDALRLANDGGDPNITLIHLIYRDRAYETHARDYEFSRISVEEHWEQGRADARKALATEEWRERAKRGGGITVIDPGRKTKHYSGCGDRS